MAAALRNDLLEILACPKCKGPVRQDGDFIQCQQAACRLRYPIRDGSPVMLIDEAVTADLPRKDRAG
jgi:uncharacterized protein YbaR (Trm112 family)